jgi:hypothetical protein
MSNQNVLSDYIKYNNLLLDDGTKKTSMSNTGIDCITNCTLEPNCQGVNIIKNEIKSNEDNDGYNYTTKPQFKCQYVNNICYSNTKSENKNGSFFYKKTNSHLESNVPLTLKENNLCLSAKNNILDAVNCNNLQDITPVFINTENNSIKVGSEGDYCISHDTNSGINLNKCNTWNSNQKFVYENIYNTLRPYDDTTKCVNIEKINNGTKPQYKFVADSCSKSNQSPIINFENYHVENMEHFENYDYSVDMVYYIIYTTMLCMIAILVIFASK